MKTWIALLRGINVGGNNILPMKDLREMLQREGFGGVRTYIQSGNCVFQSDLTDRLDIQSQISSAIDKRFGFKPSVLVLEDSELGLAIAANPYPQALEAPKTVHLYFLATAALEPDLDTLEQVRAATEEYTLTERVFYLHAPDGIGRSKLANLVEQKLGVATTARNYRTAVKIAELLP
nr:DUF1697 domain-containing protein [Hyphomonas sp. Mor2]